MKVLIVLEIAHKQVNACLRVYRSSGYGQLHCTGVNSLNSQPSPVVKGLLQQHLMLLPFRNYECQKAIESLMRYTKGKQRAPHQQYALVEDVQTTSNSSYDLYDMKQSQPFIELLPG